MQLPLPLLLLLLLLALGARGGRVAIGIDLGTTYSCVGVWRAGAVAIVPNAQGNRITPSWVAYPMAGGGARLVGEAAKNQAPENPRGTLYDSKRLLGRRFDDAEVQAALPHLPFAVVATADGKPVMELPRPDGSVALVSPEVRPQSPRGRCALFIN